MAEFFTWALLITFAGASAATSIVTQFLKEPLRKIPTQFLSYIVALIVLLLATAATGSATYWGDWALIPFNAILVSMASNGTFAAVSRFRSGKGDV